MHFADTQQTGNHKNPPLPAQTRNNINHILSIDTPKTFIIQGKCVAIDVACTNRRLGTGYIIIYRWYYLSKVFLITTVSSLSQLVSESHALSQPGPTALPVWSYLIIISKEY